MPMLLGLIQILLVGLAVFVVWLAVYTAWALTHPPRRSYAWALARNQPGDPGECDEGYRFEEFSFDGRRGTIECWRVRGSNPAGPVVVMTHGWGSSKQGGLKRIAPIARNAREVLLWDLPGHGGSSGMCTLGTHEHTDLCALIETIEPGVSIVLYGWSMGAGVSLRAAHELEGRVPIAALVCESPYVHAHTPAGNVMRLRGFPTRVNLPIAMAALGLGFGVGARWRGFRRDRLVGDRPTLVLHGTDDPVCPIDDARAIVDGGTSARLVPIEGGGHNNLWTDPALREQMDRAVDGFVRTLAVG